MEKKILILGATASEIDLARRAQELGYYVIVTDNHDDWTLAPAKYVADEAWNISWSDIDALKAKCRERGVGGASAGYSEFRVENLIKLCAELGFPCYATAEQLEITRDKIKFKETCRRYGVPTVKEYASPADVDEFPVIVKPVDRAGSIGVGVATNAEELRKAVDYAMDKSLVKRVIIERYMQNVKVDFYYAVEDGKIELISSCDTIPAADNGFERVVQTSWLYPSRHLDAALAKVDASIRRMIEGMGIRYGCIFYSGFVDENDDFVFFECGFRLEGGRQYEYTRRRGLMNFQDIFILHAMTGTTRTMERGGGVKPSLKCATINVYAKAGTIAKIEGFDRMALNGRCSLAAMGARVGQKCDGDKAILDKIGMFSFCSESPERLREDVEKAYSLLTVEDADGNDMVYDRLDAKRIETHWN